MKPKVMHLDNGLTVINANHSYSEFVYISMLVNVGPKNENKAENGLSHFVEHAVFLGTERCRKRKVDHKMAKLGTHFSAETGDYYTRYDIVVLKTYALAAIELLADMLLHPCFPEQEIAKEKKVIIQESIDTEEQDIMNHAFASIVFNDKPWHLNVCGPHQNIKDFSRNDIHDFWQRFYTAPNSILTFSGALDDETAYELAEKYFSEMSSAPVKQPQKLPYLGGMPTYTSEMEGMCFALGFNMTDERKSMVGSLILEALGGSYYSRLLQQIREKRGLVYSIGAKMERYYHADLMIVEAYTSAENFNKVLALTCENILKLQETTISQQELNLVKQRVYIDFARSLDDFVSCGNFYQTSYLFDGRCLSSEEIYHKIYNVSRNEFRSMAEKIFQTPVAYAIEGCSKGYMPYNMVRNLLRK